MFRFLFLLLFFVITVPMVNADPITFDFGQVEASTAGGIPVNLNTPNLLLTPIIHASGDRSLIVGINVTVDPGQTWAGVSRFDWNINGAQSTTFNISCQAGCTSQFIHGLGSSIMFTTPFYTPVPVSLTISIINDQDVVLGSHTFNFSISEPVPEPATLLLLGSGLAALPGVRAAIARRRRR